MTRKAKGWLAITFGTALMAAGAWSFWWGLREVTALPAFGECGFGETVDDAGNCVGGDPEPPLHDRFTGDVILLQ
jgi:hypothetical protein